MNARKTLDLNPTSFCMHLENLRSMSNSELENVIKLCIGRVLRLGSRSTQPGDVEQYEKCSRLAIEANEILNERR